MDLCFQYFFYTLNTMISFLYVLKCIYFLKLLLIISLRLITSLIPIFFTFFNQTNFFGITSMTIHHSNAFFQFSIFFFFINNCLKILMTNFIIYQCLRYFTFNLLLANITILLFFFLFISYSF